MCSTAQIHKISHNRLTNEQQSGRCVPCILIGVHNSPRSLRRAVDGRLYMETNRSLRRIIYQAWNRGKERRRGIRLCQRVARRCVSGRG